MLQVMALISEINKAYLDVSIERSRLSADLQKSAKKAKSLQLECESNLYECHILEEEVENVTIPVVDLSNLDILEREEYIKEAKISEEEAKLVPLNKFMKQRLDFEIKRYKKIKEHFQELTTRSNELKNRLSAANKLFAPIVTKLRTMEEDVNQFLEKTPMP